MNSVVLGGSTGAGAAIVKALAGEGNRVVTFHRGKHLAEARAVEVACETRAKVYICDVGSTWEAVQAGLQLAYRVVGVESVNTFVHALSGASVGPALSQTPQKIERTFALMAHSFLWWAKGLQEHKLLAPNATLIGFSNPAVLNYSPYTGVIGAAKAALESYARTLAIDLGREGHRVIIIRFGVTMTPALEKIAGTGGYLETAYSRVSPMRRLQTSAEIGDFVSLLVNNAAATRALNGSIVDFDGGTQFAWMNDAIWHA